MHKELTADEMQNVRRDNDDRKRASRKNIYLLATAFLGTIVAMYMGVLPTPTFLVSATWYGVYSLPFIGLAALGLYGVDYAEKSWKNQRHLRSLLLLTTALPMFLEGLAGIITTLARGVQGRELTMRAILEEATKNFQVVATNLTIRAMAFGIVMVAGATLLGVAVVGFKVGNAISKLFSSPKTDSASPTQDQDLTHTNNAAMAKSLGVTSETPSAYPPILEDKSKTSEFTTEQHADLSKQYDNRTPPPAYTDAKRPGLGS